MLRQILQQSITSRAIADELADRWSRLYAIRGDAVHYDESAGDLAVHPAGIQTDPVIAAYSVETAQEAWSVLVDTLQALIDDPKAPAAAWVAEHREAVAEFL